MLLETDEIVDIPDKRVKFFGGTGKMLLPGIATVEKILKDIPTGRIVTTNIICRALSKEFGVRGTCPVTTKKAIIALAKDSERKAPYWRVINQNGGLISQFPGGIEVQATLLTEDGFELEPNERTKRVKNFKESLYYFQ